MDGFEAAAAALHALADDIQAYLANPPREHLFVAPIVDWHHDDYAQASVVGLSKLLTQVVKERQIMDSLVESSNPPADYSTNLVALQGVWDAFRRATPPLVGVRQDMDRRPGPGGGSGAGATKVDIVARGGDEWIKVNTIKESRLLMEFREHDSYATSDFESDDEDLPPMRNSLLTQATAIAKAAESHKRSSPDLPQPRVKYVLTRLDPDGHSDVRVSETLDAMRAMGIELEFASQWESSPRALQPAPVLSPFTDIILDLSVLIALCCDSTHFHLPTTETELESRFRLRNPDGTLAELKGSCRDLRDQLRCETERPLFLELNTRLAASGITPRLWVTREVRDRLPGIVDVIGGTAERARARALFDPTLNFWAGSRWEGQAGILENMHIRVLEDEEQELPENEPQIPFDRFVMRACKTLLAISDEATPFPSSKPVRPKATAVTTLTADSISEGSDSSAATRRNANGRGKKSKNPLRSDTVFPPRQKAPSGHTLRTLLAGVGRRATVLTNNRGAVHKVLREVGVPEGIPDDTRYEHARIWVVNPSSLAEWRRLQVEESAARVGQVEGPSS